MTAPTIGAPANITVVRTAEELQQATLTGAVDIEIWAHLDLRGLRRTSNPEIDLHTAAIGSRSASALLYGEPTLRSIRVRRDACVGVFLRPLPS